MKYLIIVLFSLFVFQSCAAQRLNESQIKKAKERDLFIKEMSDSLNGYDNNDCIIPDFFLITEYDRSVGYKYWLSNHATVSLRKLIIDNISNRKLLECVLNSDNEKLKTNTPLPENASFTYNKVPYQEYSTYDLVKLRVEELENLQKLGRINN